MKQITHFFGSPTLMMSNFNDVCKNLFDIYIPAYPLVNQGNVDSQSLCYR